MLDNIWRLLGWGNGQHFKLIDEGDAMANQDTNMLIKKALDEMLEEQENQIKVRYKDADSQATISTEHKQQVHDASYLLQRISNIYEAAFSVYTPHYSTHNFAKVFKVFLQRENDLKQMPFFLNVEGFKQKIITTLASNDSGFNDVTYEAFTKTIKRGVEGYRDLIKYCKDHDSSLSNKIAYCSERFIDHVDATLSKTLNDKKEGNLKKMESAYEELSKEGSKATEMKGEVHEAGIVLSRISKIHEDTYARLSSGDKTHNFAKLCLAFIKNPEVLEQAPYQLNIGITPKDFMKEILREIRAEDGGISYHMFSSFNETIKRTAEKLEKAGVEDLINYCKLETQSPSDEKAYCTNEFIDYAAQLLRGVEGHLSYD